MTGFGLLGHSYEMASGSGVTIRLHGAALPLMDEARAMAEMGIIPGGAYRNMDYVRSQLTVLPSAQQALLDLAEKLAEQKLVGEFGRENIESKQINVTLNFNSAEARCNAQVLENIGEEVRLFSKKIKINS